MLTGLGGQLLTTVLGFVVRTVFIRTLGKEYLGINGLFSNILSMLSLTELGLGTAMAYMLYKPLAVNDEKRVRVLLKFYKTAYRVIGVVIFLLGLLMVPFLRVLIKDYDSLAALGIDAVLLFFIFLLSNVSSYLFLAYRSSVMRANQKRYILDIIGFGVTILVHVVGIVILVVFKDFIIYKVVSSAILILQSIVNGIIVKKYYPEFFKKEKDSLGKEEIKGLFKDCGALFVYKANTVVIKATDNIVLSAFIGLKTVGMYSNYLLLYTTCASILRHFFDAIRASMGNVFAVESAETKYRFFKISNFAAMVLYGTAAVGLAACSNEVILCWIGADYVIPQPLPILIGIEMLFGGIIVNLSQIREVSGVFRQMWYRPLIGIVVNIVVSIVLAQIWGINGVVIGTIVTFAFVNFMIDPQLIHKYTFNGEKPVSEYYGKNLLYILIIAAVGAGDVLFCQYVFVGHGWFSVAVHVLFTGISVPAVFALLFWKTDECRYLVGMVTGAIKKISNKFKRA
ncbi:MAG: oligosaccharide flippase family protein [Clostridiales bacterium]|nr:oligosaccharide flippase family protein [Clostridiales bacterium]